MRLSKIEFSNFRCFRSEVIEFGNYTSLVGPNNCGKSTALRALSIFFGGNSKASSLGPSDFYIGSAPEAELSLKFEFVDVFDEAAQELSHYVRNGRVLFEIVATRNTQGLVNSRCRGVRYGLPDLIPFFSATTAGDRRPLYNALREAHPEEFSAWQNMTDAVQAVRTFEAARPDQHVAIPSEESAYGVAGPLPILKKFIDWIYIPAVKDASSEATEQRDSAFSKLILFAVRNRCDFSQQITQIKNTASGALQEVLDGAVDVLNEVGGEIDREFKNLTTTPIDVSIEWGQIEGVSVREPTINSIFKDGRVLGPPEIFGHGLQRTYLIALLGLASKIQNNDEKFRLLLGVEEPELYQHPPQARFLANALADLSSGNCQAIVTTHSPHFVSGRTFESIRVLRKRENSTTVQCWTIDEQRAYCAHRKGIEAIGAAAALSGMDRSLQPGVAELFFAGRVILVEGQEDIAILEAYLRKIGKLSDFLRAGCHFVAAGGKTKMPMLIALARGFCIDVYSVVDFDMNRQPQERANQEIIRYAHDVDNLISEQPDAEFAGDYFFGWHHTIQHALVTEIDTWGETKSAIALEWGWTIDRMDKDPMLLAEAVSRVVDAIGEIAPLKRVCDKLEQFWTR